MDRKIALILEWTLWGSGLVALLAIVTSMSPTVQNLIIR